MSVSKWDLFKQIDNMPTEKYKKIKEYLDRLNNQQEEVILEEQTKLKFSKAMKEYSKGEYLNFDEVFEDGEENV